MRIRKKGFIILLLSISMVSLLVYCQRDFSTNPDNYKEFYLKYTISGGIMGMYKGLEVFENHKVTYQGDSYRIKGNISQEKLYELYNLLVNNDYFNLDSLYEPEQIVMDDIYTTITFQSSTRSKTVTVSSYYSYMSDDAAWKDKMRIICKYLNDYITALTDTVTTGKVTVRSKSILEEWPFSEKISLADNLSKNVGVDEEVYNYLKEQHYRDIKVTFFEGEYLYHMNGSGGYGLTYSELDTFYISIHSRNHGIFWPFEMKLSEITDEGYNINGPDLLWLSDTLNATHYPRLVYDTSIKTGEYVYELSLLYGNNL